jgi:hypothetical protein
VHHNRSLQARVLQAKPRLEYTCYICGTPAEQALPTSVYVTCEPLHSLQWHRAWSALNSLQCLSIAVVTARGSLCMIDKQQGQQQQLLLLLVAKGLALALTLSACTAPHASVAEKLAMAAAVNSIQETAGACMHATHWAPMHKPLRRRSWPHCHNCAMVLLQTHAQADRLLCCHFGCTTNTADGIVRPGSPLLC